MLNPFLQAAQQGEFGIKQAQGVFGELWRAYTVAQGGQCGEQRLPALLRLSRRLLEGARHDRPPVVVLRPNQRKKMLSVRQAKALRNARSTAITSRTNTPAMISAATPVPST